MYHDAKFYKQVYSGHLNLRQLKPITFMGPNKEYVVAASDRETVFIWDTKSGDIVNIVTPDSNVEGDAFLSHVAVSNNELVIHSPAATSHRRTCVGRCRTGVSHHPPARTHVGTL